MRRGEKILFNEALLGEDAKKFLGSDLGLYLQGAARQDVDVILDKLKTVSPFKFWKIQQYQSEIMAVEKALAWINEVIVNGRQAIKILEQGEE